MNPVAQRDPAETEADHSVVTLLRLQTTFCATFTSQSSAYTALMPDAVCVCVCVHVCCGLSPVVSPPARATVYP